jgi:hypothetical protein
MLENGLDDRAPNVTEKTVWHHTCPRRGLNPCRLCWNSSMYYHKTKRSGPAGLVINIPIYLTPSLSPSLDSTYHRVDESTQVFPAPEVTHVGQQVGRAPDVTEKTVWHHTCPRLGPNLGHPRCICQCITTRLKDPYQLDWLVTYNPVTLPPSQILTNPRWTTDAHLK